MKNKIFHIHSLPGFAQKINAYLAGRISFFLFCKARPTPVKQQELAIMSQAQKTTLRMNGLKVTTYAWGNEGKPVLLIHGWESRASRFYLFISELIKQGYQPVTFDAPGHGESEGSTTNLLEYYEIIQQLQEKYGVFEAIIAHSLGVLNTFYAIRQGIQTKSIVAISGVCEFNFLTRKYSSFLKLTEKSFQHLKNGVENLFIPHKNIWEIFSAHYESKKITQPILIIHDKNDEMVEINQAKLLYATYKDRAYFHMTQTLGHHRILIDMSVIQLSIKYIAGGF
jgi:pimeloyl-ACP methyl ester carboxylesterase